MKSSFLFFVFLLLIIFLKTTTSASSTHNNDNNNNIVDEKSLLIQAAQILQESSSSNCTSNWRPETPLCNFSCITCNNVSSASNQGEDDRYVVSVYFLNCDFRGAQLPAFLFAQLKNIQAFSILGSLSFPVPIPEEIGDMTSLQVLSLDGNSFVGTLPKGIGKLYKLTKLSLSSNFDITGGFPQEWGNLSSLETFVASNIHNLGGAIPRSFGNLQSMVWFACVNCGLEGDLPEELSNLVNLESLNLGSNKLINSLPAGFSRLAKLRSLVISGNQLSILPASWNDPSSVLNLREFTIARNNFSNIPLPTWKMNNTNFADLSGNKFIGSIPNDIATLMPELAMLDLSDNLLEGHVPSSFVALKNLKIFSVAGNCISTTSTRLVNSTTNETVDVVSFFADNIPSLTTFDLTPGKCLRMPVINTSAQLASPYTFLRSNPWGSAGLAEVKKSCASPCDLFPYYGAVVPSRDRVFLLTFFCTDSYLITFAQTITFDSSCITALYRPVLVCFTDAQGTVPCDASLLPPAPSWNNVTRQIPTLPDSAFIFDQAENAQYLHGAFYSVVFTTGTNFVNGTFAERIISTQLFQGPNCDQSSSVAVYMSTSCSPCVNLGKCDGSINIQVGEETPAWRISSNLLPFYECPKQTTSGCWTSSPSKNNNNNNNSVTLYDGSTCRPNYKGPLCAKCESGFGKVGPACVECPSSTTIGILFASGLVILVLMITGVVWITLQGELTEIVKKDRSDDAKKLLQEEKEITKNYSSLTSDEEESERTINNNNLENQQNNKNETKADQIEKEESSSSSCCCSCCISCCEKCKNLKSSIAEKAKATLAKYRTQLERVVVVVRQLVNHFSLVGALASVGASQQMLDSVQRLLLVQQSGNTFVFGSSYAATLSCMFPEASSASVLTFNLVWAVFGGVFFVEAIIFLAWFRRGTVTAAVALFLSFLAYAPLTENAAKLLSLCNDFNFYDSSAYLLSRDSSTLQQPKKVLRLLSSDLAQDCDEPDFVRQRIGAALTLSLFSIGLPLFILFVHKKLSSQQQHQDQDQVSSPISVTSSSYSSPTSTTTTSSKKPTEKDELLLLDEHLQQQQHHKKHHKKIHFSIHKRIEVLEFLTQAYRRDVWFYELIVMARKMAIALILGVLPGHSSLQLQFYTAVCAILLALSLSLQPLETINANRVEQGSIVSAALCAVMISLVATFPQNTGISVFAAVVIFVTQIVVIATIIISSFGALCFANNERIDKELKDEETQQQQKQSPSGEINKEDDSHHFPTSGTPSVRVENSRKKFQPAPSDAVEELKSGLLQQKVSPREYRQNVEGEEEQEKSAKQEQVIRKKDEEIAQLKKLLEELKKKE
jgi:Leucine-rich repeat (LRR) protein